MQIGRQAVGARWKVDAAPMGLSRPFPVSLRVPWRARSSLYIPRRVGGQVVPNTVTYTAALAALAAARAPWRLALELFGRARGAQADAPGRKRVHGSRSALGQAAIWALWRGGSWAEALSLAAGAAVREDARADGNVAAAAAAAAGRLWQVAGRSVETQGAALAV